MTTAPSSYRCGSCGFEAPGQLARCPRCNRASPPSGRVRVVGALLSIIGAGLSLGMAYLLVVVGQAMRPSAGGGSFTGTPRDATYITAILGAVLVFGITSLITGLWQVIVGRRSLLLSAVVLLVGLATVVLVVLFQLQGK